MLSMPCLDTTYTTRLGYLLEPLCRYPGDIWYRRQVPVRPCRCLARIPRTKCSCARRRSDLDCKASMHAASARADSRADILPDRIEVRKLHQPSPISNPRPQGQRSHFRSSEALAGIAGSVVWKDPRLLVFIRELSGAVPVC
eukprot:2586994-Rhodomonas_salina.8